FFFQAEDGIRDLYVTGVQTCALPISALAKDKSPDVLLQVAIAARKITGLDAMPILLDVLAHCGDDKLIPHIVWQNLHPLLEKDRSEERRVGKECRSERAGEQEKKARE